MDFLKFKQFRSTLSTDHLFEGVFISILIIALFTNQILFFSIALGLIIASYTTLQSSKKGYHKTQIVLQHTSDIHLNQNNLIHQKFDAYSDVSVKNSTRKSKRISSRKESSAKNNNQDSIPYLKENFEELDADILRRSPVQTISVLSYFATSLFEKNNKDEVLWDIVENCIAYLNLEDCVIYMLDKENKTLIQKAAFGNKNNGEKKIVSPIQIKIGNGIVGKVAQTGKYQCIKDVTSNKAYIVDDAVRKSELSVPIYIKGKVIGVLDSEHSQANFFTKDHIFLFQLIAKLTEKKLTHIYNNSGVSSLNNDNSYFKELEQLMKEAKIYRDPNLGLCSVAHKIKISSNYLSQLVNKLTGKNFTDYINTFRVEDAKLKLTNKNYSNYTIVGIGLESGFNSKSTFYSAFKKLAGKSPSTYRQEG
ncbi:helix-turn-helix domain-containing protein [Aquimarina brevivitae]|uniref:GAF domain-containing protein n=1 Tax=Aquimarina brevivitae TaxID=323412 RepID=A0A4Q7PGA4_9FLAO|nr:helix-turn-helix domain-containing protein [Aquimarina brevivitae]RZS99553.1 GAF domain-containing protein [Aquimarina brevivitae]